MNDEIQEYRRRQHEAYAAMLRKQQETSGPIDDDKKMATGSEDCTTKQEDSASQFRMAVSESECNKVFGKEQIQTDYEMAKRLQHELNEDTVRDPDSHYCEQLIDDNISPHNPNEHLEFSFKEYGRTALQSDERPICTRYSYTSPKLKETPVNEKGTRNQNGAKQNGGSQSRSSSRASGAQKISGNPLSNDADNLDISDEESMLQAAIANSLVEQ